MSRGRTVVYRPKMTFEQLRAFIAAADELHVTKAADLLGLSQSAVSTALSNLEDRYGVKLFNRVGRRIELTSIGKVFLQEAKGIIARAAGVEQQIAALSNLAAGSLSISASQTIGNYWVPRVIARFKELHPAIEVHLYIGNTQTVAADVEAGEADLGLVEGPIASPVLEDFLFKGDSLKIVVSRDFFEIHADDIRGGNLRAFPWILRESGSGTRAELDRFLSLNGINLADLPIALEFPTNEAVRLAVEAGAGAAAVSGLVVESGLRSGQLIELDFNFPQRYFHLLWHRDRFKSAPATSFVDLIVGEPG